MARPRKNENEPKPSTQELALVPVEEQPYPLPEGWKWVRLGDCNCYTGETVNPALAKAKTFELYSVPSSADDYPEIILGSEIGSSKQSVDPDDVLLCKINPRINRVWRVTGHTQNPLIASSEWIIFRNKNISSKYMMYCMRSEYFRKYMLSNVSGVGGSLMRAQPKHVRFYPIPLPPLDEQERIVAHIESLFAKLDEAKEKAEAVLDSYETRKAAILHKAFTGELTAKWREEKGIDLSTWQIKAFSDIIFETKLGLVRSKSEQSLEFPNTYLKMNNISSDGQISLEDITKVHATNEEITSFRVLNGDFLFNTRNSYELVGKSAVFKQQSDEIVLFNNNIMRIRFNKNVDSQYVSYFFLSTRGKKQLDSFKKNTTNIAAIYAKNLNDMQIPVAFLDEQKQIARILDNLLEKEQQSKAAAEAVLEQIDLMKKAILAKAFRGELG